MSEFPGRDPEVDLTQSHEIAQLLRSLGEGLGFDEETCNEIANMAFEEAFETAYGYLTQAGLEADEVLADFLNPTDPNLDDAELITGPNSSNSLSAEELGDGIPLTIPLNTFQGLMDGNAKSGDASN